MWNEPFEFVSPDGTARYFGKPNLNSWYFCGPDPDVRDKYPSVMRWEPLDPGDGWRLWHIGVIQCPHCALFKSHTLDCPNDAFYKWEKSGIFLWAFSRKHALVLREYIASKLRKEDDYPSYTDFLRQLPKEVLIAKHRAMILRMLDKTLAEDAT
jgi:hypothetical protein